MEKAEGTIAFRVARAGAGPALYLAAAFSEDLRTDDPFYPRTRLCQFGLASGTWLLHDIPYYTTALLPIVEPVSRDRAEHLVSLCATGELFHKDSQEGRIEEVRNSETFRPAARETQADLLDIAQIEIGLYICGGAGQIYGQFGTQWELLDPTLIPDLTGMREAIEAAGNDIRAVLAVDVDPWMGQDRIKSFHNINGPHEYEIYVTGYDGGLLHWNGERSRWITDAPKNNLFEIVVEDERRIWICGSKGTLLRGNHRDGFADLSPGGGLSFNTMTLFQGKLWITANSGFGGPTGLFTFDNGRLDRVTTGLVPDIDDIHHRHRRRRRAVGCRLPRHPVLARAAAGDAAPDHAPAAPGRRAGGHRGRSAGRGDPHRGIRPGHAVVPLGPPAPAPPVAEPLPVEAPPAALGLAARLLMRFGPWALLLSVLVPTNKAVLDDVIPQDEYERGVVKTFDDRVKKGDDSWRARDEAMRQIREHRQQTRTLPAPAPLPGDSGGNVRISEDQRRRRCKVGPYAEMKDACAAQGMQAHHIVPDYALRYGNRGEAEADQKRIPGLPTFGQGMSLCVSGNARQPPDAASKPGDGDREHYWAHDGDREIADLGSANTPMGTLSIGRIVGISTRTTVAAVPQCAPEITTAVTEQYAGKDLRQLGRTTQALPTGDAAQALPHGATQDNWKIFIRK